MHQIIDTPYNIGALAERFAAAGVRAVFRYYNIRNSTVFPDKCLTRPEYDQLTGAGLAVAVVFQQRGGAGGQIDDLSRANGRRDAGRSVALAGGLGQPAGSAIYFAVDHDYYRPAELDAVAAYFAEAAPIVRAAGFRVGCYGSGAVGDRLRRDGLGDFVWLAGATGWSGTRDALRAGRYTLFQSALDQTAFGTGYDGNELNPAGGQDFGQFGGPVLPVGVPGERIAIGAHFAVAVRTTLNLRGGPGTEYPVLKELPAGTVVAAIGTEGDWLKVDLEGDGTADGYLNRSFVERLAGGLPLAGTAGHSPLAIAEAERDLGVAEFPGPTDHSPRILMYHATTTLAATTDEVAWCSSFVNWCVEQSGRRGTDSAAALSWRNWGADVSAAPQRGDLAVFRRGPAADGTGHVGFWLDESDTHVKVLGGNQGNRVQESWYPKDGGGYRLLSVRRG